MTTELQAMLYEELARHSAEYAALRRQLADAKDALREARRAIEAGLERGDALQKECERAATSGTGS